MTLRVLFLSLLAMGVSSCAWTAQKAQLMPQVSVQPANLGGGSSVYVHAVDERQSDVLGNRAAGAVGAKISVSSAEIVAVVDQSLVTGLRDLGFAPSPQPVKGVPELRVEIRVLEYKVSMGFWAGSLDIDAAMKAICIRGNESHLHSRQ